MALSNVWASPANTPSSSNAKQPIKMLRQSTCLFTSAAEVLDQIFRQWKSQNESTKSAHTLPKQYVVVDFRPSAELESQAVFRCFSTRLPTEQFYEDNDRAVSSLLSRIADLLSSNDDTQTKSGAASAGQQFLDFVSPKQRKDASPITPRLTTLPTSTVEPPHIVIMSRGSKKSTGLDVAASLLVRHGCTTEASYWW